MEMRQPVIFTPGKWNLNAFIAPGLKSTKIYFVAKIRQEALAASFRLVNINWL